ncbi:response regulator [Chthonobacter albigriseus]|uniref:response regulator n=1 Tax=Chthonobacter albigriseus TaxID=1683161 RepID=UPI001888D6B4|nr:response regulator [Chthonobacter albigriseus]
MSDLFAQPSPRARILVVDDDDRNLIAIETILDPVGQVVSANSGEEALRYLLKQDFAVILLDVFMPGLDGYETAHFIRQREQSRYTPIIFLTAINKEDAHMLRGYDMGAVDYVFKPFDPTILKSKVSVFVDLYDKSQEIRRSAVQQQRLLEETLRANTERLEMEKALRHAEERQALILRSLPVALYEEKIDDVGRIPRFVGGDLYTLTGYQATELNTQTVWTDRIHPDDQILRSNTLAALLNSGAAVCEYRWQGPDGRYRHFLDQAVLLRNEDGEPIGIAGTLLDVTERRQLEDSLVQSQKLDAVGKLTGGVAHDLNNLLASVLGGLRLVERRTPLTDDVRQIVEMTRHAAEQGAELIRRMLAFSRRQHLRPDVVHLNELRGNMEGMVSHILGGLVRFEWAVGENLWPAYVDAGQLELALMNLIVNARDAMPDGGTVRVSAENRSIVRETAAGVGAGDYIVVSVSDTGCGISSENLEKVIEPFFTTKDIGKGTGLGLSTVYGFARQSGGTLSITSLVGSGTNVEIWLPRSPVEKVDLDKTGPKQQSRPKPKRSVEKYEILLVDDTPLVRDTTAAILSENGFSVVAAAGGGEALALLEKEPQRFDLIITDFAMPIVSGLEVVRFARNLRADMPVLIITGYADTSEISNRPSNVPVIGKPYDEREFLATIHRLLRTRRAAVPRI